MEEDKTKLIEVYTGSLWEAELVRTMLGDNGIETAIKDALLPNLTLPAIIMDVSVLVNEIDYEPAMEVVRAYEKNTDGD